MFKVPARMMCHVRGCYRVAVSAWFDPARGLSAYLCDQHRRAIPDIDWQVARVAYEADMDTLRHNLRDALLR